MGYLYENSNPERFQHFCQSLLIDEFPALQCLPVGQRDGGRDGWDADSRTVLQVKFRRTDTPDSSDWLIKALRAELPKIEELAKRGAERYIMATNGRGTAQLDAGSIDKVQKWLDENMPIPSVCFWRDELDRRFDAAESGLKLKYSEMLTLEDGIEIVLSSVLGSDNGRQKTAIRSFIATQFDADQTVKFKQVDLSNELLGLFVDIPVSFSHPELMGADRTHAESVAPTSLNRFLRSMMSDNHRALVEGDPDGEFVRLIKRDRGIFESGMTTHQTVGMAEVLLSGAAQDHLKLVVLEGAPGQGKSTLAQYVCQMHRARYLKKDSLLQSVPAEHGQTAFRVPIKVDLRDYARFLSGRLPFSDEAALPGAARTLEVFLAQLISFHSGGISFDAYDVMTLLKGAPVLLFLDGLDEVADYVIREDLVASVGDALNRWREIEADIQVVVTSRPSVFGRAPSFKRFGFVTLTLGNIDDVRIGQYADKWIAARNLDRVESREVKKILSEKLEAPHIRHLTRNPMQLTILLSLIHQRGHSLPDQRTDLYRRYVDLFLTREADKSTQVRNNRDLLLGFIQHLAWALQIQAETSKGAGSITAEDLQTAAREYMIDGGHPVEMAAGLFGGGLERIFVLVERIQGLYEFEVQPLREYFCAQHLYETAPVGTYQDAHQSAIGQLGGDRAQRFEALARNPFWLNVCRFYAGSCTRGETGTLVYSLREMISSGDIAVSMHARRVALALLQDWVFSSVKFTQADLIRSLFDATGVRLLLSSQRRAFDDIRLAAECGSDVLRDLLFGFLKEFPGDACSQLVCFVLRLNEGFHLRGSFERRLTGVVGPDRTEILRAMFRSGAVARHTPDSVWALITSDDPHRLELVKRSTALLDEQPEIAVQIAELVHALMAAVTDGLAPRINSGVPLGVLAKVLGGQLDYSHGFKRSSFHWFESPRLPQVARADDRTPDSVRDFLEGSFSARFGTEMMAEWPQSAEDWRRVIEHGRTLFGDCWAMMSLALRCAGLSVPGDATNAAPAIFDPSVPLGLRVRVARLRRGGTAWWLDQLALARSEADHMLWAGLVIMWASAPNIYNLADEVNRVVDSLSEEGFTALTTTVGCVGQLPKLRADRKKLENVDLSPFSGRAALLVALAFPGRESSLRYSDVQANSDPLRRHLESMWIRGELSQVPSWRESDEILRWALLFRRAQASGLVEHGPDDMQFIDGRMLVETARLLVANVSDVPAVFVDRAVLEIQRRYRPKVLANVVAEEKWSF